MRVPGPTALAALLLVATVAPAQPELEPTEREAVAAVSAHLEVEEALLQEDVVEYDRISRRRKQVEERLVELHRQLEVAIHAETSTPLDLDTRMQAIERAEGERDGLRATEREQTQRILERRRRIELIAAQVAALQSRSERELGALTGTWQLTLLPIEQHGTVRLTQNGTLVTGTYVLDGGFTGSLEGTFIDHKVRLDRIDSRLGRMMELEGRLSGDGRWLRGRWLNRELAGSEGANGQWSAERRAPGGP